MTARWRFVLPALLCWLHLSVAYCNETGGSGGRMDVRLEVHTRPGGSPANPALGINTINIHLAFSAEGIRVDRQGKFAFRVQGEYHLDSYSAVGGSTLRNDEQRHDMLQGTGTFAEDGTLMLELAWTHGPGLLIYTANPGGTFSAQQPAVATPHVMQWQLAPASRQVEELGRDRGGETIKYQARRPSTVVGTQSAPMTERVEIKVVRGLVPRG
jgi:hypothetical protein